MTNLKKASENLSSSATDLRRAAAHLEGEPYAVRFEKLVESERAKFVPRAGGVDPSMVRASTIPDPMLRRAASIQSDIVCRNQPE